MGENNEGGVMRGSLQTVGRRLSIAMATCNGAPYVRAQLDSFVRQTRLPDELVVCDDASTDGTQEILRKFQASAPFAVNVVLNPARLGIVGNFEQAIGACTGELIFLSDQDDVWLEEKLSVHERAHRRGVGWVFSNAMLVDAGLMSLERDVFEATAITPWRRLRFRYGQGFDLLLCRNMVPGFTMSFDAALRDVLLPVPAGFLHDNWIALALSTLARCEPIAESMALYRTHERQAVGLRAPHGRHEELARTRLVEESMRAAAERLVMHAGRLVRRDVSRLIAGRIAYQRSRTQHACKIGQRLAFVLENAVLGRYLRYSGTITSDILEDIRALFARSKGAIPPASKTSSV